MTLSEQNLRCQVLGSAADSMSFFVIATNHFGKTKVGDFNMAIFAEENVFWFKVAIDNPLAM
jgi:hypothetical protein